MGISSSMNAGVRAQRECEQARPISDNSQPQTWLRGVFASMAATAPPHTAGGGAGYGRGRADERDRTGQGSLARATPPTSRSPGGDVPVTMRRARPGGAASTRRS
jgi:hypothetical protein